MEKKLRTAIIVLSSLSKKQKAKLQAFEEVVDDYRRDEAKLQQENRDLQSILRRRDENLEKALAKLDNVQGKYRKLRTLIGPARSEYGRVQQENDQLGSSVREMRYNCKLVEAENEKLNKNIVRAVGKLQEHKDDIKRLEDEKEQDFRKLTSRANASTALLKTIREQDQTIRQLRESQKEDRETWTIAQEIDHERLQQLERQNELLTRSFALQSEKIGLAEAISHTYAKEHNRMIEDFDKSPSINNRAMRLASAQAYIALEAANKIRIRLQDVEERLEQELIDVRELHNGERDTRVEVERELKRVKNDLFNASNAIVAYEVEVEALNREVNKLKNLRKAPEHRHKLAPKVH